MINRKTILYVDGYNVINAWPDLKKMLDEDFDGSREKLNEYMFEYAAYYGEEVWVVYDAYLTSSKKEKLEKRNGVYIVYTKEHQTADSFIERAAKEYSSDGRILLKVVTSDWVHQRQVLGNGGIRLTPWELKDKCVRIRSKIENKYKTDNTLNSTLESRISNKSLKKLTDLLKES